MRGEVTTGEDTGLLNGPCSKEKGDDWRRVHMNPPGGIQYIFKKYPPSLGGKK